MAEAGLKQAPSAGMNEKVSVAALRWRILKRSLISGSGSDSTDDEIAKVSRVPSGSFGFFTARCLEDNKSLDYVLWEYSLPDKCPPLQLRQARSGQFKLKNYSSCRQLGVDNTGVVCLWPAEEILAYYCLSHPELFRNKRVIELGAGYGLAGLALAAGTEAAEVLITDGNPLAVNYIQESIHLNGDLFGQTKVSSSILYWSKEPRSLGLDFDMIIAADCTYFKNFHEDLVHTIRCILEATENSQAVLFCPTRGRSLEEFVEVAKASGLNVCRQERYDDAVWKLHIEFLDNGNSKWLNYDQEHNYPELLFCSA